MSSKKQSESSSGKGKTPPAKKSARQPAKKQAAPRGSTSTPSKKSARGGGVGSALNIGHDRKKSFDEKLTTPVGPRSARSSHLKFKKIEKPDNIPEDQWNLPIFVRPNGKYTLLSDIAGKKNIKALTLGTLSGRDKKKLVIKRIKDTPNYPAREMLGVGTVDKEKAIKEIKANSPAGKFITESEQRVIQMMVKRLNQTGDE